MERGPERAAPSSRYGPARRALLLVVGALAALAGFGLSALFVGLLVGALLEHRFGDRLLAEAILATSFGVLIFVSFGVLGVVRVASGIRGRPVANPLASAGVEGFYRRNWYAVGLAFWGVWVAAGLVSSGARAFFLAPDGGPGRLASYALLAHLVLPLHVAVHELGHAAAASLVGLRFASMRVGWLTIRREGRRTRASWERPAVSGAMGFHAGVPVEATALRGRLAAHAIAGPLTTLAAAFACRAGAAAIGAAPSSIGQAVAMQALQAAGWVGIVLAVINIAPFRTRGGLMSDGAIVLHALARMTPARRALLAFHVNWALGRRPREWGVAATELLGTAADAGADRDVLLLAATSVALDSGDEPLAIDILRRALGSPASPQPLVRYELELQAVMIEAFQGRTVEARERLGCLGPHPTLPEYPRLAEAVVEASVGAIAAAGAALDAWERAVERTPTPGSVRVGNVWAVERLRARLAAPG